MPEKSSKYDLLAVILLLLLTTFSLIRIPYLPQFVDGYYHLSVAQGFLKSGGWVGWDWWDFAPLGRPHLYPPLYHFFLAALLKLRINNLLVLQITEGVAAPVFFSVFWLVMRSLFNKRMACFALAITSSFFPLYVASTGNVPATMAMVFGLLSVLFFMRKNVMVAAVSLTLAFYSHAAIPWMFTCGYLVVLFFNKEYRLGCCKVIIFALIATAPLFYHQLKYLSYLQLFVQGEIELIQLSIFIFILALIGLVAAWRDKFPSIFFIGFLLGTFIVFYKYPYRIFSAQGMAGAGIMAAIGLEKIFTWLKPKYHRPASFIFLVLFLFFHPALHKPYQGNRLTVKVFNSTYYRLMTGRVDDFFMFNSLFFPKLDMPVADLIQKNTAPYDIISSNYRIMAQTFSAFCNRANSYSMLSEIKPPSNFNPYDYAKIVVWLDYKNYGFPYRENSRWQLLKTSEVYEVYLHRGDSVLPMSVPSKIPFSIILTLLVAATIFIVHMLIELVLPGRFFTNI